MVPRLDVDNARIALDDAIGELRTAEADAERATTAVRAARGVVEQAQWALEHADVLAPADGIIVVRNVAAGESVPLTLNAPLFSIATDIARLEVPIAIAEGDIGAVESDERVEIEAASLPGAKIEGCVSAVRRQSDSATAIVTVLNPADRLKPGMLVTVTLGASRRDRVVRIPNGAFSFEPSSAVLRAIGQPPPVSAMADSVVDTTMRRVWRFDGTRFTPVDVRIGLADEHWTELVGGAVGPGAALVTSASPGAANPH